MTSGIRTASAGVAGMVFGAGLALSGMTNPAKVLGFLDPLGRWDPTLAFVMGGALAVAAVAFRVARGRRRPWLAESFAIPARTDVDPQLLIGAMLFGLGWGLVGLCPGPALANLFRGRWEVELFVGSMVGGVLVYRLVTRGRARIRAVSGSGAGVNRGAAPRGSH
jgi:uncharacterized membrane protein YedE/YeeE